jgi:hypothetical protein
MTLEELRYHQEELEFIKLCKKLKVSFLEAKIAGIIWKNDGAQTAKIFLNEIHYNHCAVLT